MPQLFRPPRFPAPLEPSPPLDPTSMPIPPPPPVPVPPLAAEDEERRPWPPLKKKMRPVNREFGSMERAWGMAMIGLHIVICIVMLLSFAAAPAEDRFLICLYLCFAAMVVITCVDICYDDPSPQQKLPQAAVVQLPPPPPEMDMC